MKKQFNLKKRSQLAIASEAFHMILDNDALLLPKTSPFWKPFYIKTTKIL